MRNRGPSEGDFQHDLTSSLVVDLDNYPQWLDELRRGDTTESGNIPNHNEFQLEARNYSGCPSRLPLLQKIGQPLETYSIFLHSVMKNFLFFSLPFFLGSSTTSGYTHSLDMDEHTPKKRRLDASTAMHKPFKSPFRGPTRPANSQPLSSPVSTPDTQAQSPNTK